MDNKGPLAGVTIIEMASLGPGPFCAMMLADLGADVIRVDRAGPSPWGIGDVLGRGRRSIAVDLKKTGAAALVLRLIQHADALIEGYRPGVMERLGLGPDPCMKANPRLVYGRMTGWGQEGPLACAPGHDINYLALSGMLWPIGPADRPPPPPLNLVGDFGGGGMMLALGILAGILSAKRTGEGQVVDAAMVDGAAVLGTMIFGLISSGSWTVERHSNFIDGAAPFYGVYECSDGRYVSIGSIEPQFYEALLSTLDLNDPRFAQQWDRSIWPDLRDALTRVFRTRTRDEWSVLLEGSDICFAPVLDPVEATQHRHNVARGTFGATDDGPLPIPAPRFSNTPTSFRPSAGANGSATTTILQEIGLSEKEIRSAFQSGVVAGDGSRHRAG